MGALFVYMADLLLPLMVMYTILCSYTYVDDLKIYSESRVV